MAAPETMLEPGTSCGSTTECSQPNSQGSSVDSSYLYDDLPVAEYARRQGLTIDHTTTNQLFESSLYWPATLIPSSNPHGLLHDPSLPPLQIPALCPRDGQLTASKRSLQLIGDIVKRPQLPVSDSSPFTTRYRTNNLKLESPLLETDPDHDLIQQIKSMAWRMNPLGRIGHVPLEPLSASRDEDIAFPSSAHELKRQMNTTLQKEKLEISKNILVQMADQLRDTKVSRNASAAVLDETRERYSRLSLTPPLFPLASVETEFVPDRDLCLIPLASDPDSLIDEDLKKATTAILKDSEEQANTKPSPPSPSISSVCRLEAELQTEAGEGLGPAKIESPLMGIPHLPPFCENPLSNIDLGEFVMEHSSQSDRTAAGESGATLRDIEGLLQDTHRQLMRKIEQEQLQAADARARIPIPVMDFEISQPGWKSVPLKSEKQLGWILEGRGRSAIPIWPENKQASLALRWKPFIAGVGCELPTEDIPSADDLMKECRFSMDESKHFSSSFVWKRPGLAILEDEPDEEMLQPLDSTPTSTLSLDEQPDLATLVHERKRKYSSVEKGAEPCPSPPDWSLFGRDNQEAAHMLTGCDEGNAATNLLNTYVHMRQAKKRQVDHSLFFPAATGSGSTVSSNDSSERSRSDGRTGTTSAPKQSSIREPLTCLAPCPELVQTEEKHTIIRSIQVDRQAWLFLEKLCPELRVVERDFGRFNSLSWNPKSVSRSPVVSALASEADLIVSPSTGIIITTLIQAIQVQLPGRKTQVPIRQRVVDVAARYQRLVVLVSERSSTDESAREWSSSERIAFANFVGFASGLEAEVVVTYVGGGSKTLAAWLARTIRQHAAEAAKLGEWIIEDETQWEVLLRRAGMNAYAAQAVFAKMNEQGHARGEAPGEQSTLLEFLRLSPSERLKRFRDVVGGDRVMARVNQMLERAWEGI